MHLKNFFSLTLYTTLAKLKAEISRYHLGCLWWIIDPIFNIFVFFTVFRPMLGRGMKYGEFLVVGFAFWLWFNKSISNSCMSIYQGRSLMQQVSITKIFFPLVDILHNSAKQLFVICLLILFLVIKGIPINVSWLALPLLVAIQFVLICGCGFLCAAIVPFIPDLNFLVGSLLRIMFFVSGVIFDISKILPPEYKFVELLNPMAGLLKNYRQILLSGMSPDWGYLGILLLCSLALVLFSLWLIRRLDHVYPRICQ